MGTSPSKEVDLFADVTFLQPGVALPLDITCFISGWTKGVPPSLIEFFQLSTRLSHQLELLPRKNENTPENWILLSKGWSQDVVNILNEMHAITIKLLKERPTDLTGNYHPIEEWKDELGSTLAEFKGVAKALQCKKAEDNVSLSKAITAIRKIHLLHAFVR